MRLHSGEEPATCRPLGRLPSTVRETTGLVALLRVSPLLFKRGKKEGDPRRRGFAHISHPNFADERSDSVTLEDRSLCCFVSVRLFNWVSSSLI